MIIKDFMTRNPIIVSPYEYIKNTYYLLKKHNIKQLPVVEDGSLIGVVTDRDLRMALVQEVKAANLQVGDFMSKNPVTISEDSTLVEAARVIRKYKFNALPVVNKTGKMTGIITATDILYGLLRFIESSR